jgi:hypothetical protein
VGVLGVQKVVKNNQRKIIKEEKSKKNNQRKIIKEK